MAAVGSCLSPGIGLMLSLNREGSKPSIGVQSVGFVMRLAFNFLVVLHQAKSGIIYDILGVFLLIPVQ